METLTPAFVYRHTKVRIITERSTEFIDLTESLEDLQWKGARKDELVDFCTSIGDSEMVERIERWQ